MAATTPTEKLPPAGGSRLLLVTSETYEKLRALIGHGQLIPDPEHYETTDRAGKKHFRPRPRNTFEKSAGGGGGAAAPTEYIPWAPTFFTTSGAGNENYKCRFNLGTVNEVVPENWNEEHSLGMGEDSFYFVILTVTGGSGKVTTASIDISASAPSQDSVARGTPPVSFKVVLGAVGRTSAQMIVNTNISATATEVYRESKSSPAQGQELFTRWWRWSLSYN
jgi:hypothetical protein